MATLTYEYNDLPLAIENGISAGFINGQAEIVYSWDGAWVVSKISLEGFGERDKDGKRQWPQVSAPAPIVTIVCNRLYNEWFERVQNRVNETIEKACESRVANTRDHNLKLVREAV